ncbi:MAG: hypothetical protein U1F68_00830 [Gammaproteobacteria bacterium]
MPNHSIWIAALPVLLLAGCSAPLMGPDLGGLYNSLAQQEDPYRNPVVVIPGLIGSRLVDRQTNTVVWGAFGFAQSANPKTAEGARLIALPIATDKPFRDLRDEVMPDGALDRVVVNLFLFPVALNAYYNILRTLGVGGYRDQDLGEAGAINYGDKHFTCFQFDYDWRRDIVESAQALDAFLKEKRAYVQREVERRYGIKNHDVKFNLVAHSMGGLVARYYLRYGAADLPSDGSLPKITWAGADLVDHLVMVGTPNAGSLDAIQNLVEGYKPAPFFPYYSPAVLGTMPSIYELLPRSRHRPLLKADGQPVADILDPELWRRNGWGLADPGQASELAKLLPEFADPNERRRVALEFQARALKRAEQFTRAMDTPAHFPATLKLQLIAGDSVATPKTLQWNQAGNLKLVETGAGDGTVLRRSALLDERITPRLQERLRSPIEWDHVLFLFADHLRLTQDPAFTDNLLYFLLESPRQTISPGLLKMP